MTQGLGMHFTRNPRLHTGRRGIPKIGCFMAMYLVPKGKYP